MCLAQVSSGRIAQVTGTTNPGVETQAKSTVKENFIGYLPLQLNYNFWTVLCIVNSFFSLPEQEKMLPKSKIGRTS